MRPWSLLALALALAQCAGPQDDGNESVPMFTFGDDLEFLRQRNDVILLASGDAQVAVVAAYQGRVMTSTSGGLGGPSFGWLNREHIAAAQRVPHINCSGAKTASGSARKAVSSRSFSRKAIASTSSIGKRPSLSTGARGR